MEKMYWQIEKFSGSMINLMDEDKKIYSEKLTKKQVENLLCLKLRVARKTCGRKSNYKSLSVAW